MESPALRRALLLLRARSRAAC